MHRRSLSQLFRMVEIIMLCSSQRSFAVDSLRTFVGALFPMRNTFGHNVSLRIIPRSLSGAPPLPSNRSRVADQTPFSPLRDTPSHSVLLANGAHVFRFSLLPPHRLFTNRFAFAYELRKIAPWCSDRGWLSPTGAAQWQRKWSLCKYESLGHTKIMRQRFQFDEFSVWFF